MLVLMQGSIKFELQYYLPSGMLVSYLLPCLLFAYYMFHNSRVFTDDFTDSKYFKSVGNLGIHRVKYFSLQSKYIQGSNILINYKMENTF